MLTKLSCDKEISEMHLFLINSKCHHHNCIEYTLKRQQNTDRAMVHYGLEKRIMVALNKRNKKRKTCSSSSLLFIVLHFRTNK